MPNVLIRDLPDDVHAELQKRATAKGQSLQQYLSGELARLTRQTPISDVLDRIDRRTGGTVPLTQSVDDLDAERESR